MRSPRSRRATSQARTSRSSHNRSISRDLPSERHQMPESRAWDRNSKHKFHANRRSIAGAPGAINHVARSSEFSWCPILCIHERAWSGDGDAACRSKVMGRVREDRTCPQRGLARPRAGGNWLSPAEGLVLGGGLGCGGRSHYRKDAKSRM